MQETQETQVQSLGWKDPVEEEMANYSIIFAGTDLVDRGAWRATVRGVLESQMRVRDWARTHWGSAPGQRGVTELGCWPSAAWTTPASSGASECFPRPHPQASGTGEGLLWQGTALGKRLWEAAVVPRERRVCWPALQHPGQQWSQPGSPEPNAGRVQGLKSSGQRASSCKGLRLHKAAGRQGRAQAMGIINNTVIIVTEVGWECQHGLVCNCAWRIIYNCIGFKLIFKTKYF